MTDRRKQFEKDTAPHLDALWQGALWLTLRGSLADDLLIATMLRGYREWNDSEDSVGPKVRLFRTLTREFLAAEKKRCRWKQHGALSENASPTASSVWKAGPDSRPAIERSQLPLLSAISDVTVKGAIARLRPQSRLFLLLLFRERMSYSDIAFVMDLSRDSARTILIRLRRVLPRHIIATAERLGETSNGQSPFEKGVGEFGRESEISSLGVPSMGNRKYPMSAATEKWDNEDGADDRQSRG